MRKRVSSKKLLSSEAKEFLGRQEAVSPRVSRASPAERLKRTRDRGRANSGLRNMTMDIHQILIDKYPNTINIDDIADELSGYLHCRRRVADVLNVLNAAGMITSRKKDIRLVQDPREKKPKKRQRQTEFVDVISIPIDDPLDILFTQSAEAATPPTSPIK